DHAADLAQMHVAGHELGERVDDRDDRLSEILVAHTGGAPEGARAGHVPSVSGRARAVLGHGIGAVFSTRGSRNPCSFAQQAVPCTATWALPREMTGVSRTSGVSVAPGRTFSATSRARRASETPRRTPHDERGAGSLGAECPQIGRAHV